MKKYKLCYNCYKQFDKEGETLDNGTSILTFCNKKCKQEYIKEEQNKMMKAQRELLIKEDN